MSSIGFNSNIAALFALRQLDQVSKTQSSVFERLSSGLRINRASDDAAGLAIASSLNASTRVYSQAIRNANDGISALSIADGALDELSGSVIRMKELATQAANGTLSTAQRLSLQSESDALIHEYNRVLGSTAFNGLNLLDLSNSTMNIQVGYGTSENLSTALGGQIDQAIGSGFNSSVSSNVNNSTKILVADINNDGTPDVISSGSSGLSWYQMNSDGSVFRTVSITAAAMDDVAIGDINGDGNVDVVGLQSGGGRVRAFTNSNSGSSWTQTQYNPGATTTSITLADLNADGILDLIASTGTTSEIYGLGNGDGSFGTARTLTGVGNTGRSIAGDFNGDGKVDILASAPDGRFLSMFLGNGNGTFKTAQSINDGLAVGNFDVASADFNRDGALDLVLTRTGGSGMSILLGNGDGTFQSAQAINPGNLHSTSNIVLNDFNKDGFVDIFTASSNYAQYQLGNGNGTFGSASSMPPPATSGTSLALADFNGDGVMDSAVLNSSTKLAVFLANTNQTTVQGVLSLATQSDAKASLATLDTLLTNIDNERGIIGAMQSRLSSALNTLTARRDGYKEAAGRITDADVAFESANLLRTNILKQSATAVLSQASQQPSLAIQLLKNL